MTQPAEVTKAEKEFPVTKDPSVYVSIAQWGNCKVCGKHDDLRFGSCFTCSDFVKGEHISPTTHRMWDSRNPKNEWFVSETQDLIEIVALLREKDA